MALTINDDEKLFYVDDTPIILTKREYLLGKFFIENPNKIFSRQELIKSALESNVNERTVDVTIYRLRKKLGEEGKKLISRSGFGYGYMNK